MTGQHNAIPPPPGRDDTGPHHRRDTPLPRSTDSRGDWVKFVAIILSTGVFSAGGGGAIGAFGARALTEYRIDRLEHDIDEMRQAPNPRTLREVDRVAALASSVDERRQADHALVQANLTSIDARLEAIETSLRTGRRR